MGRAGACPSWLLIPFLSCVLILAAMAGLWRSKAADGEAAHVVFTMRDPSGDDRGGGELIYPTHAAFEPFHGLFDLRRFQVSASSETAYFDLTFGEITNPFSAPEGFYHQRIDVYIAGAAGEGSIDPFLPGPRVRFHRAHPWTWRLRVAPFGGTRLHSHRDPRDSPGQSRGITVAVLPDGKTIRVGVPVELMGRPDRSWRYYVLVGGYDHFGDDEWRDVVVGEHPWAFGVEAHAETVPRLLDVAAPARGLRSQSRQLGVSDPDGGPPAQLYPVGPRPRWVVPGALAAAGLALAAAIRLGFMRIRHRRGR